MAIGQLIDRLTGRRPDLINSVAPIQRQCGLKWSSDQDRNPHECRQPWQHLTRHRCGCGVTA